MEKRAAESRMTILYEQVRFEKLTSHTVTKLEVFIKARVCRHDSDARVGLISYTV